ncbi:hypothetical protein NLJ89_g450 [Agrocybe chaxingu]|uniref:F-box domain-containing protein n=1 Tax=Agrocybe chaxingu TaxID=84603 RepID=A0A9W8TGG7_9AGAR|nr:hypothetical protein NLJ89_g450 [Agrocybe chaxingu]
MPIKTRRCVDEDLEGSVAARSTPSARTVNTTGLAILSDELLLEIMSSYPPSSLLNEESGRYSVYPLSSTPTRHETLLALSQTCRNLRRFFRPYVWQCLELCGFKPKYRKGSIIKIRAGGHVPGTEGDGRNPNTEIIRLLGIVTRCDPTLANFVNKGSIINVQVVADLETCDSTLSELACCMTRFPNLHTIKVIYFPNDLPRDIPAESPFKDHTYPQICNLLLDEATFPLVLSCPNARNIQANPNSETFWSLPPYRDYASATALQEVGIQFRALRQEHLDLLSLFPSLRTVSCDLVFYQSIATDVKIRNFFRGLSRLSHLKTLRASILSDRRARYGGPKVEEVLSRLKRVMLDIQKTDHEDKTIVYTLSGEVEKDHSIYLPFQRDTV